VKIEDGARIQKLVHESMNRLKNCSESDESDARVHESYSQIFDSFDSRFIRKIRKIRVQITPLKVVRSVASSINRTVHTAVITVPYGIVPYG
jgi:hypothetical protein